MTPRHEPSVPKAKQFSRLRWLSWAYNLFWVSLVTILIWIYADMKFTGEEEFDITLKLDAAGRSKKFVVLPPDEHRLSVVISGSQTSLEQFRKDLSSKESTLFYDVSQEYSPGQGPVSAADLLEKAARLKQQGITIKSVKPEAIDLNLDKLLTKEDIPVKLNTTGASLQSDPAPGKVTIRVPETKWEEIKTHLKGQKAKLETLPVDLSNRPLEEDIQIEAEINPFIQGIDVQPVQQKIAFTVRIISPLDTESIPVTVKILTPTDWARRDNTTWEEYVFVPNPALEWRLKLEIEGEPKDLKPENIWAYIKLTDDDKQTTTTWLPRELIVSFAPDTNLKLKGSAPKMQFRLEKRKGLVPAP